MFNVNRFKFLGEVQLSDKRYSYIQKSTEKLILFEFYSYNIGANKLIVLTIDEEYFPLGDLKIGDYYFVEFTDYEVDYIVEEQKYYDDMEQGRFDETA